MTKLTLADLGEHIAAWDVGLSPVTFQASMVALLIKYLSFALCAHSITSVLNESSKLVDYVVVI